MTGRRSVIWLVAGLALALLGGRWLAGLYADWAFDHALGADAVWQSGIVTATALRLVTFVVAFSFVFANLFAVRQSIVSLVLPRQVGNLEIGEAIPTRRLTLLALGGALLVGVLFALVDQDWTAARLAFGGEAFREMEPYLDRDLGFYVNWLPFERAGNGLIVVLVVMTTLVVVALYASTPSVRWDDKGLYVSTWVRRHLGVLGSVSIVLVGWHWRLDRFGLLGGVRGSSRVLFESQPFGLYDHRILLPYLAFLGFMTIPVALVFGWAVWRSHLRLALGLLTALFVGGPVARTLLPLVVPADPGTARAQAQQRSYQPTRMLFTRRAYGVDQIASADTIAVPGLAVAQMANRVSSWDPAALSRFLERERRGTDVEVLTWNVGAMGFEALLLRGAASGSRPGASWPADHLSVTSTDIGGFPSPGLGIGPRALSGVLFHPGATRYALVPDTGGRIAAPPFETGWQRLAQSWDQQDPRLFAAELPSPRPRLLTHRDVAERIRRLAPFLEQGETITPVVHGDSLYWVAELFSVAEDYPLSEPSRFAGRAVHYVQHAATAVVQAQSGRVMLLPVARPDPVMRSWMRLFPAIFTSRSRAPRWMVTALPPATDWVLVQGAMLGRTGVFGDTLPVRSLARADDADADLTTGPATFFQLDSSGTLGWGIPIVGASTLSGMLVGHGGLALRTTLVEPQVRLEWTTALERLQSAADGAGFGRALEYSRRGRVQAIPTTEGPAFVQSFYDWPPDGPPHLAGVAVLRGTDVVVGRTLADALGAQSEARGRSGVALSAEALRASVAVQYDAMAAALRQGDWRAYGEAWTALGRLLGRRP